MNYTHFGDFHVHSTLSDGADEPEKIIEWAIEKGMPRLGLSEHSYTPCYTEFTLGEEGQKNYIGYVSALKEKYKGRIELYCGLEQDYWSPVSVEGCDYVIGSAHYLKADGEYYPVDWKPECILEAAEKGFGGDVLAAAEEYFRMEAEVAERTKCDIIGHFDLVSKLNERYSLFDADSERYRKAWQNAADALLTCGKPFEINTGAISRGYTSVPYPSPEIVRYLAERGAKFILSGDSHRKENLCFAFDEWKEKYSALGAEIIDFYPLYKVDKNELI